MNCSIALQKRGKPGAWPEQELYNEILTSTPEQAIHITCPAYWLCRMAIQSKRSISFNEPSPQIQASLISRHRHNVQILLKENQYDQQSHRCSELSNGIRTTRISTSSSGMPRSGSSRDGLRPQRPMSESHNWLPIMLRALTIWETFTTPCSGWTTPSLATKRRCRSLPISPPFNIT